MPELPEVETICCDLNKQILGQTIQDVRVLDPRVLRQSPQVFKKSLIGQKIEDIYRRGKAIVFQLSNGNMLVVQLMMTGQLVVGERAHAHTRVSLELMDHVVHYHDQRVFGQLRVIKDMQELPYFQRLGPEPLDPAFNLDYVKARLARSRRPIKNMLLDHAFVAGIGNIYASEILFRSKISPLRLSQQLKAKEIGALLIQVHDVLKEAILRRGTSMRNYVDAQGQKGQFNQAIQVYGRAAEPCLVCRKAIVRLVQAGRSTFYCPKCQR